MRVARWIALAMTCGCAAPGVALAQARAGGEFQVNTYTSGDQFWPSISSLGGGGFVVVWDSLAEAAIVGRRYDAAGVPAGTEFQESASALGGLPSVAGYGSGRFIVSWRGGGPAIVARRFGATGSPLAAPVPVTSPPPMFYIPTTSHLTAAADGSFVVGATFFSGHSPVELPYHLFNLFDGSDRPVCSAGARSRPESALLPDGGFAGASTLRVPGVPPVPVAQAHRFDRACQGPSLPLNADTTMWAVDPSVAANGDGTFVIAWARGPQFASANTIMARRFSAAGTPIGAELQVSTDPLTWKSLPSVGINGDGSFQVAWESAAQDGSAGGIFARRFRPDATPRGQEFQVNTYTPGAQTLPRLASDVNGNFVVAWQSAGQDGSGSGVFAQRFGGLRAAALDIDDGGNHVLEPGDTASIAPSWRNVNGATQAFGGSAASFGGPGVPGDPVYTLADAVASYGTVASGATASCAGTGDCYQVALSVPTARPAEHWDARLIEEITPGQFGQTQVWRLHVGGSFGDVAATSPFYRFVETLLHRGITAGCGAGQYCALDATNRAQMAVFALVAKEGAGYAPPACGTPSFSDVPANSPFCRWIEELARRGVVNGCGGGLYCPEAAVSREQMAVFMLRTVDPTLNPPACTTPAFADVPATSPFCRWIEELARRAVVAGCGGGNYCPTLPVSREQMGVFISITFGLTLYGP